MRFDFSRDNLPPHGTLYGIGCRNLKTKHLGMQGGAVKRKHQGLRHVVGTANDNRRTGTLTSHQGLLRNDVGWMGEYEHANVLNRDAGSQFATLFYGELLIAQVNSTCMRDFNYPLYHG